MHRFAVWPDGETCEKCASEIHSGWIIDGKKYGPTCGKVVLRKNGITWPKKYGPGSFDSDAMAQAIELQRWENGQWVYDYETRRIHKMIVGSVGWKIAQIIASQNDGLVFKLNTDDAERCYLAAIASQSHKESERDFFGVDELGVRLAN